MAPMLHETLHQLNVAGLHLLAFEHLRTLSLKVFFPSGDFGSNILSLTMYGCIQSAYNYWEVLISYPDIQGI